MKITNQPLTALKQNANFADNEKEKALKKACSDFEAIIIKQMLTTMRSSIPKDGLFQSGYSQEIYQSMYDDELAKGMAHGKGLGLADTLFDQISGKIQRQTHTGARHER